MIDEFFNFNSINEISIKLVKEALDSYSENLEEATKLDGSIPIFLDTNILLNYFGMSLLEKQKLLDFLSSFSTILITKQTEIEFVKNRMSSSNEFLHSLKRVWVPNMF